MIPLRLLAPLTLVPLLVPALCNAQIVQRVSTDSQEGQSNGDSSAPMLSSDGPLVVFTSHATTIVGFDTNGFDDVFLKNYATSATTLVSIGLNGVPANGPSRAARLSQNDQFVVFESDASNLVVGDTNGKTDIFVRDLVNSTTEMVSVGTAGQGNQYSIDPSINSDGSIVAFASKATNLVAGDTNAHIDIFVRNRLTNTTTRVMAGAQQPNSDSGHPRISGSGSQLAFESNASNLVANDSNGVSDVFVQDLTTGQIVAASRGATGTANGASRAPSISLTGVMVIFESDGTDLDGADANGVTDIYGYNTSSQAVFRVSWTTTIGEPNGRSFAPAVSGTGSHVAYCSDATNLSPGDVNGMTDVFYCDLNDPAGSTEIVSRGATVMSPNGASRAPALDWSGDRVVFESDASNMINGDTNGHTDVYLRYRATPVTYYCSGTATTHGCTPVMMSDGVASVSSAAAPFNIHAVGLEAQRSGIIFYSLNQNFAPWGTGGTSHLCLHAPSQRTGVHNSGGTLGSCEGVLTLDFNAWMATHPSSLGSPFFVNEWIYAQAWFRDPGAPKNTNLSNAMQFALGW